MDDYAALEEQISKGNSAEALALLGKSLTEKKDFHSLFYAILLKKRIDLGLSPIQVGSSDDLPEKEAAEYEDAIRDAARRVGGVFLEKEDIVSAWPYFRMIGEHGPVTDALDAATTEDSELAQQWINIALHEGANPRKGFEMVLGHYGICNSITMMSQGLPMQPDERDDCIRMLINHLYGELRERVQADIEQRDGIVPVLEGKTQASLTQLIQGHEDIFEEDTYHVDTSHLASVVRFSTLLGSCEELHRAVELCEYGMKLSSKYRFEGYPPFENQYFDEIRFLKALVGIEVDEGIAHFRAKVEDGDAESAGTAPAETFVNLLLRMGRPKDAADAFVEYLSSTDDRQLSCPPLAEICHKAGDFQPLAEAARKRGDLVNFAAGLLASRSE